MTLSEPILFSEITKEQIRDYCEASGDHNRIHWDSEFARESGLPDVIAHGMLSMGLLGEALAQWGYPQGSLQTFEAKFKDMVNPGDRLQATCRNPDEVRASGIIRLSLSNQLGTEVCSATVKLLPAGSISSK
jgi:acyl dehydratase